ncbi:MAG: PaaI family thioesterase [Paludibacteraceae bacterium]|nr:PaaI family thioesterase [Paludibacteraceae bacterium]
MMDSEKEKIFDLLGKDEFAKLCNMKIVDFDHGTAIAEMEIIDSLKNGFGTIQGGALFTLADFACAAASNSQGKRAVSLDASITFIKAVKSGKVTATASEIFLRRTVAAYKVEIRDEENDLVAVFQSTAYRKEPKQ